MLYNIDLDPHAKYYEHLLRAAESILLPFVHTKEVLDGLVCRNTQANLDRWVNKIPLRYFLK